MTICNQLDNFWIIGFWEKHEEHEVAGIELRWGESIHGECVIL